MNAHPPAAELTNGDSAAEQGAEPAHTRDRRGPAWSCPPETSATASVRVLLAAGALVLFFFVAVAGAVGWAGGFTAGVTLCFLIGFGVAPALAMRTADVALLMLVSVAVSMSVAVLVGMGMAATGAWHPVGAFIVCACVSAVGLLAHLRRDLPARQVASAPLMPRVTARRAASWVMAGTGLLLTALDTLAHRRPPTPGGLLTIVGPAWYVGLLLLVAAPLVATLRRENPGPAILLLSLPVVLSQAIAYGAPTAMAAARHIGVVEYIRAFHHLQRNSDIYQAWSGLFSGTAWLSDTARIHDPLTTVATYWPVPLNLVSVLAVGILARNFGLSLTRAWWAAGLFILTNTLNVTYFSPQSLGFFISVVILALVLRTSRLRGGELAVSAAMIVTLSCCLAVTHQISPYLLAAVLVALMAFRVVGPRWPLAAVVVPALAWALVNLDQARQYVSSSAFGDIFGNIRPPSSPLTDTTQSLMARLVFGLPAVVLVVVGAIALVALWQNRDRRAWALVVAAAAPGAMALASNYGQELIFRITLFALPMLCICAALISMPRRILAPALAGAVVVLCAVNAFGLTGMDWARTIRTDEASQLAAIERQAPAGSTIYAVGSFAATPGRSTEHYFDITYDALVFDDPSSLVHARPSSPGEAASEVAAVAADLRFRCTADCFVVFSDSARGSNDRYGVQSVRYYNQLAQAFASGPDWVTFSSGPTARVFRLVGTPGR